MTKCACMQGGPSADSSFAWGCCRFFWQTGYEGGGGGDEHFLGLCRQATRVFAALVRGPACAACSPQ